MPWSQSQKKRIKSDTATVLLTPPSSRPAEEDNAGMSDIEPRNRCVSDSAIFRAQKAAVANSLASPLREESFGLPDKAFTAETEDTAGIEAVPNGSGEAINFFECPKMILSASKPSVVTWTSTPMRKDGLDVTSGSTTIPEDASAKLSEGSGSQSSSPVEQLPSDGGESPPLCYWNAAIAAMQLFCFSSPEKESDSSRLAFGDVSMPCPLSGCDNIAADEKDSQGHLMETDATENSNDGAKSSGRPPKMARCKLCHLEFMGKVSLTQDSGI